MPSQKPRPAMVEDFDESLSETVPDSRKVANTGAKVSSRLDQRFPEPLIDGASDSGYSSRTAATVNSTQSGPSGGRSPPAPQKTDLPKRSSDLARKSSRRDRKDKERAARPQDENMQMGPYPGTAHHPHAGRSPSKPRRRDSYLRNGPDYYYENGSPYHPSTPIDSRPMDYPPHPSTYRPPLPDFHQPHMQPHGSAMIYPTEEYHNSRSNRPHSGSYRSMYHADPRPSWAVGMPRAYQQQMPYPGHSGYEHPPPPPSGVWQGSYPSSPYGAPSHFGQQEYYSQESMYNYPPHGRERSESRPPESQRHRRSSVYGDPRGPPPPPAEPDVFPEWDEEPPPEQYYSRREYREKPRGRASIAPTGDYEDNDRSKMPPPPPPAPSKHRAPQVHQQRRPERPEPPKRHTAAAAVPTTQARRSSRAYERGLDMSELMDSVNEIEYDDRRAQRELPAPERSHSLRGSRRSTSYNDTGRSNARVAVASSGRRRRPETYYPEDRHSMLADQEDLEAEAERYQALMAGRPATAQLPASHETLMSKIGNGSDSGSRKSGSGSSRGSATRTEKEAQKNMTLQLNGMTLAFTEENLAGKSISIRTGDQGATHLNITDGTKRPKPYVQGSAYSDNTGGSGRRALENGRRTRDERRSERSEKSVHRSGRSGYSHSQRYQL
ncbi:hypothetical protein N7478_006121 [Penicillium angulare]|uniref:uncharacterized protein n=1 Tax=Penicillium angulare TaxID=116970 RepID=UPI002541990E|nr:uncharacterized protein N7478_006121 [Penicillium angulare]KAJ5280749.1 hypothetical protein N7478_006121 [Penicillium angulare]